MRVLQVTLALGYSNPKYQIYAQKRTYDFNIFHLDYLQIENTESTYA